MVLPGQLNNEKSRSGSSFADATVSQPIFGSGSEGPPQAFNRQTLLKAEAKPTQDESRLLSDLLAGYDRRVRPVINASTPVITRIGITLTQIFDMVRLLA